MKRIVKRIVKRVMKNDEKIMKRIMKVNYPLKVIKFHFSRKKNDK